MTAGGKKVVYMAETIALLLVFDLCHVWLTREPALFAKNILHPSIRPCGCNGTCVQPFQPDDFAPAGTAARFWNSADTTP